MNLNFNTSQTFGTKFFLTKFGNFLKNRDEINNFTANYEKQRRDGVFGAQAQEDATALFNAQQQKLLDKAEWSARFQKLLSHNDLETFNQADYNIQNDPETFWKFFEYQLVRYDLGHRLDDYYKGANALNVFEDLVRNIEKVNWVHSMRSDISIKNALEMCDIIQSELEKEGFEELTKDFYLKSVANTVINVLKTKQQVVEAIPEERRRNGLVVIFGVASDADNVSLNKYCEEFANDANYLHNEKHATRETLHKFSEDFKALLVRRFALCNVSNDYVDDMIEVLDHAYGIN